MASCLAEPITAALAEMQAAVRAGRLVEAQELGRSAMVNLAISSADLQVGPRISEGAESVVYQGVYKGSDVAVKQFKITAADDLLRFRQELLLLATLSHSNITTLQGASALPPKYFLVMPLEFDSLKEMLYQQGWRPSWQHLIQIACQMADALAYLHSMGYLHRDIKPGNILMGRDGHIKLTDFGIATKESEAQAEIDDKQSVMSRGRPTGGFHKKRMVGTLEYMAPEILQRSPHSRASDVYAFAVTLNELATAMFPFVDCTKDNPEAHTVLEMGYGRQELAAAVAAEGLRPTLPKICPPGLTELISACWRPEPSKRPSFSIVRDWLQQMQNQMSVWELSTLQRRISIPNMQKYSDTESSGSPSSDSDYTAENLSVDHMSGTESDAGADRADMEVSSDAASSRLLPPVGSELAMLAGARAEPGSVNIGSFATMGPREYMEDRHVIVNEFGGAAGAHLVAVFDGHRGEGAAAYASSHLPELLLQNCRASGTPSEALSSTFVQLDQGMFTHQAASAGGARLVASTGQDQHPGCTALAALVLPGRLCVANTGDSRAVLCRDGQAVPLTMDHTTAREDERARIVAAGGRLRWHAGSWRIGDVGLQVTRSLGDFDEKRNGLTATPEITDMALTRREQFVVLATDGLWDVITNEEAVGLVMDTVKQPDMCAKRLVTEAVARGSADNITVTVMFLQPVSTLEQVYAHGRQSHAATPTFFGSRRPPKRVATFVAAPGVSMDEVAETY